MKNGPAGEVGDRPRGDGSGVVESSVATELFMCTSELCFDNALRHREIDKQPVCMDRRTLLAQCGSV